ncbi:hypothetical protein IWQ60_006584 [Tieghemiomyces parasiticus]|uniref:Uncharacterized protein n=1 Tax=Tieghemiomyces parasiticus TaxID=78921 RepID=A0A9W8A3Q6_9FUNG|nr:hypothetical protein IWQ60_006584 [Tieghemiomyces parasiticus]
MGPSATSFENAGITRPQDVELPGYLKHWLDIGHGLVYSGRELSRVVRQALASDRGHIVRSANHTPHNKLPEKFLTTLTASLDHLDVLLTAFERKLRTTLVFDPVSLADVRAWVRTRGNPALAMGPADYPGSARPALVKAGCAVMGGLPVPSAGASPALCSTSHGKSGSMSHAAASPASSARILRREDSFQSETNLSRGANCQLSGSPSSAVGGGQPHDLPSIFCALISECRSALAMGKSITSLIYLELESFWYQLNPRVMRSVLAVFQLTCVEFRNIWCAMGAAVAELDLPDASLDRNLPSPFTVALQSSGTRPIHVRGNSSTSSAHRQPLPPNLHRSHTTSQSSPAPARAAAAEGPSAEPPPRERAGSLAEATELPRSLQYSFRSTRSFRDDSYQITLHRALSPAAAKTSISSAPKPATPVRYNTPAPNQGQRLLNYQVNAPPPSIAHNPGSPKAIEDEPTSEARLSPPRSPVNGHASPAPPPVDPPSLPKNEPTDSISASARGSSAAAAAPVTPSSSPSGDTLSIYERFTRNYAPVAPSPQASRPAVAKPDHLICMQCDILHSPFTIDQKQLLVLCNELARTATTAVDRFRLRIRVILTNAVAINKARPLPTSSHRRTDSGSNGASHANNSPVPSDATVPPPPRGQNARTPPASSPPPVAQSNPNMVSHFRRFSQQHPLGSLGASNFSRRIFHAKHNSDGSTLPHSPTNPTSHAAVSGRLPPANPPPLATPSPSRSPIAGHSPRRFSVDFRLDSPRSPAHPGSDDPPAPYAGSALLSDLNRAHSPASFSNSATTTTSVSTPPEPRGGTSTPSPPTMLRWDGPALLEVFQPIQARLDQLDSATGNLTQQLLLVVNLGCYCHLASPVSSSSSSSYSQPETAARAAVRTFNMADGPVSPSRALHLAHALRLLIINAGHFIRSGAALALAIKAVVDLRPPEVPLATANHCTTVPGNHLAGSPDMTAATSPVRSAPSTSHAFLDDTARADMHKLVAGIRKLTPLIRQLS